MPITDSNPSELCDQFSQVEPTELAGLDCGTWRRLDEEVVPDARSGLTPAQMVDHKFQMMMGSDYRADFQQPMGRSGAL
jgi:hypothetical protein